MSDDNKVPLPDLDKIGAPAGRRRTRRRSRRARQRDARRGRPRGRVRRAGAGLGRARPRARWTSAQLLQLGPGTVLELDRKVGEAIDIYVNNRLVARGEVVLVEDKLGVTMTEIIKTERTKCVKDKERTMRLLIVGTLKGQLTTATKIAMDRGAAVTHAESIEQALAVLRSGKGADLLMVDVAVDIRELVARLELEHIHVPIVACGIENNARAAVDAIHAGAKEYIPLPPDPELIAAVLAAVADDSRELIYRDDAMAQVVKLATADRRLRRLGADHRRVRHRQGGAGALRPYPLEPRQEAVHLRQLRRDPGEPAGVRAVRPREGRLHRRGRAPHRQVRGGHRRHAAARRNLRNGRAAAGQAPARHPGARDRPRRRHAARCRSTSASSPPRTATSSRPRAKARSARICCSASTS